MSDISGTLSRIESWMESNYPDGLSVLRPGMTHDEIDTLVGPLNLPNEYYDLYKWRRGGPEDLSATCPIFFGADLIGLGPPYLPPLTAAEEYNLIFMFAVDEYCIILDLDRWGREDFPEPPVAMLYANTEEIEGEDRPILFQNLTNMMIVLNECLETGACWIDKSKYNILTGSPDQVRDIHRKYNPKFEPGFHRWIRAAWMWPDFISKE